MFSLNAYVIMGIVIAVLAIAFIAALKAAISLNKRLDSMNKTLSLEIAAAAKTREEIGKTQTLMNLLTTENRSLRIQTQEAIKKAKKVESKEDFFDQMKENNK